MKRILMIGHLVGFSVVIQMFYECFLQQIMKDRWINTGFDEEELKPFIEPELDIRDQKRIGNILYALSEATGY